jgi:hypothetical protein
MKKLFNNIFENNIKPILILAAIWLAMAVLVNPIGNFPLNDDWSYGYSVRKLVEQGIMTFSFWVSMPLIALIYWGALFCIPFGFSFTALRISSLVAGLIGVLAVYFIFDKINSDKRISFLAALIMAVNPLYFSLANTFMTDVPFFAASAVSLLFFYNGIQKKSMPSILMGTVFGCFATLIRQFGFVIPFAFSAGYLVKYRFTKKNLIVALFPFFVSAAVFVGYEKYILPLIGIPESYYDKTEWLIKTLHEPFYRIFAHIYINITTAFIYCGFFLFPFLLCFRPQPLDATVKQKKLLSLSTIFFAILLIGPFLKRGHLMPLSNNVFYDFGLGPALLSDMSILKLSNVPRAPLAVWIVISLLGIWGGAILFRNIFIFFLQLIKTHSLAGYWPEITAATASIVYFSPFSIACFFDRYLIFIFPLLLIIFAGRRVMPPMKNTFIKFLLILTPYAVFSVCATHDYLSWQRARWQATNYLTNQEKIPPDDIDGGFEFSFASGPNNWSTGKKYFIAFGPVAGYTTKKEFPYQRWIPIRKENILILQKTSGS